MSLYLTFIVGNEYYCIDMANVVEILSTNRIIPIHQQEKYVKGFINFSDKMVPVIDLRTRFLKEIGNYDDKTCVIIAKKEKIMVGLIVDKIDDIMPISKSLVDNSFRLCCKNCQCAESTLQIGERRIKLVHCKMLLTEKEWMEIELLFENARFYYSKASQ